jgi:hypothetical protein
MLSSIFRSKLTYILLISYLLLFIWWIQIQLTGVKNGNENYYFNFVYAFIAFVGAINGLVISRKWGGFNSYIGRGIIFFSLGLLGEWFGETVWSYYNIVAHIQVPFPSIADAGYFSIIPFYSLGIFYFAKSSGAKFTLKSIYGKLILIIIPAIMLTVSYFLYLKNLNLDTSQPLTTFLNYGYPIGEAITISLALLTYGLTNRILGGNMKSKILFIIFALGIQYLTDSTFLYTAASNTYFNAGPVDMMYTTSFLTMALALIALNNIE